MCGVCLFLMTYYCVFVNLVEQTDFGQTQWLPGLLFVLQRNPPIQQTPNRQRKAERELSELSREHMGWNACKCPADTSCILSHEKLHHNLCRSSLKDKHNNSINTPGHFLLFLLQLAQGLCLGEGVTIIHIVTHTLTSFSASLAGRVMGLSKNGVFFLNKCIICQLTCGSFC